MDNLSLWLQLLALTISQHENIHCSLHMTFPLHLLPTSCYTLYFAKGSGSDSPLFDILFSYQLGNFSNKPIFRKAFFSQSSVFLCQQLKGKVFFLSFPFSAGNVWEIRFLLAGLPTKKKAVKARLKLRLHIMAKCCLKPQPFPPFLSLICHSSLCTSTGRTKVGDFKEQTYQS